jgi:hypothetical protein
MVASVTLKSFGANPGGSWRGSAIRRTLANDRAITERVLLAAKGGDSLRQQQSNTADQLLPTSPTAGSRGVAVGRGVDLPIPYGWAGEGVW